MFIYQPKVEISGFLKMKNDEFGHVLGQAKHIGPHSIFFTLTLSRWDHIFVYHLVKIAKSAIFCLSSKKRACSSAG